MSLRQLPNNYLRCYGETCNVGTTCARFTKPNADRVFVTDFSVKGFIDRPSDCYHFISNFVDDE